MGVEREREGWREGARKCGGEREKKGRGYRGRGRNTDGRRHLKTSQITEIDNNQNRECMT